MSIKVYLNYEGEPKEEDVPIRGERKQRPELKLKITLPEKWVVGEPCQKVLDLFVNNYNKKFADKTLDASVMDLRVGGVTLPLDDKISSHIREYADVFIQHKKPDASDMKQPEGSVTCTNYGCGNWYFEKDNTDTSCKHHTGAPVFWDTCKYWSCCADAKAYDFEDFQKIPPCAVGKHTTKEKTLFAKSIDQSVENKPLTEEQIAAQKAMAEAMANPSSSGPRVCGPREFEGAARQQQQPQEIKDGKATCRNFGCGNKFVVAENNDTACTYHSGGPVFHDTYKYWSCCPDKKHYEFEDFAAVPGCTTGPHKL